MLARHAVLPWSINMAAALLGAVLAFSVLTLESSRVRADGLAELARRAAPITMRDGFVAE